MLRDIPLDSVVENLLSLPVCNAVVALFVLKPLQKSHVVLKQFHLVVFPVLVVQRRFWALVEILHCLKTVVLGG